MIKTYDLFCVRKLITEKSYYLLYNTETLDLFCVRNAYDTKKNYDLF